MWYGSGVIASVLPARPMLRGYLHLVAALGAPFGVLWLVLTAGSTGAYVTGAIFGASVFLLFAVSAAHHLVRWPAKTKRIIHRLDHAMIFLAIAGMYTPFCLQTLPRAWGIPILSLVCSLAGVGALLKLLAPRLPRWVSVGSYLALGWLSLVVVVPLAANLPAAGLAGLVAAGCLFSAGAAVYGAKWPNPLPRLVGHHEIFHGLQTSATLAVYVVVAQYAMG